MNYGSNVIPLGVHQRWHAYDGDPVIPLMGTMVDKLALALARRNLVDPCSPEDACAVSAVLLALMRLALTKTGLDRERFLRITEVGTEPIPLMDANAADLASLEDSHTFVGVGDKSNATLSAALVEIGDLLFVGNFEQLFDRTVALAGGKHDLETMTLT